MHFYFICKSWVCIVNTVIEPKHSNRTRITVSLKISSNFVVLKKVIERGPIVLKERKPCL